MRTIIPTLLILISIVAFLTFTKPHYATLQTSEQEYSQYDQALAKAKDLQRIRETLLTKYNAVSSIDSERLKKMLPDNADNVQLIIDIQNVAARYGLTIKNLKNNTEGEVTKKTGSNTAPAEAGLTASNLKYGATSIGFTTSASYEDFQSFIKELEKSLRILDITSITFTGNDTNVYDFNINLKAYWLK